MINSLLSPEDAQSLSELSNGNWESFWLQGGVFTFLKPTEESVYIVPTLIVNCSAIVQIDAVSVEQTDGSELLPISLKTLSEIGTAESERLWKPPRCQVTEFPDDLKLSPFLHSEIAVDVVVSSVTDAPILDGITFKQGEHYLLVASSRHMPESIIVTSREDYISAFLKNRIRIPLQKI